MMWWFSRSRSPKHLGSLQCPCIGLGTLSRVQRQSPSKGDGAVALLRKWRMVASNSETKKKNMEKCHNIGYLGIFCIWYSDIKWWYMMYISQYSPCCTGSYFWFLCPFLPTCIHMLIVVRHTGPQWTILIKQSKSTHDDQHQLQLQQCCFCPPQNSPCTKKDECPVVVFAGGPEQPHVMWKHTNQLIQVCN